MTPAFTSRVLASSNRPTNMGPSPPTWHGHAPRQPLSVLIGCGTTASFGALVSVGALLSGSGALLLAASSLPPGGFRRLRRVSSPRRLRDELEFTLGTGPTSNCAPAWCGAMPGGCGAAAPACGARDTHAPPLRRRGGWLSPPIETSPLCRAARRARARGRRPASQTSGASGPGESTIAACEREDACVFRLSHVCACVCVCRVLEHCEEDIVFQDTVSRKP